MVVVLTVLLVLCAALLAVVTLLPLSGRHDWWVRMWDFPRLQLAIAQAATIPFCVWLGGALGWTLAAVTLAGLLLHLWRIRPFTPLARREMRLVPSRGDGHEVTLLAANVLMQNDGYDRVAALVDEVDPDVLFLMETDRAWIDALGPTLARYPTVLSAPRDDCYGMVLATRLQVEEVQLLEITRDETPTAYAALLTPAGRLLHFVGLHPRPPVPGVGTKDRDAQILYAARFARRTDVPLIAMGDFNDAAWSDTSRLFKRFGRYLDPRVGRGLYASFSAKNPLIRCAIDQIFLTEEVGLVGFSLGPKVGSDHFPVIARVRIDTDEARALNRAPPRLDREERAEIDARLAAYAHEVRPRPVPAEGG